MQYQRCTRPDTASCSLIPVAKTRAISERVSRSCEARGQVLLHEAGGSAADSNADLDTIDDVDLVLLDQLF